MKVSIVGFSDLPEGEKAIAPSNGVGKAWANYLKVEYDNGECQYFSDAMEPEDATFTRALSWIAGLIQNVSTGGVLTLNTEDAQGKDYELPEGESVYVKSKNLTVLIEDNSDILTVEVYRALYETSDPLGGFNHHYPEPTSDPLEK